MPSCSACGKELEPLIRAPHTNYVKSLYSIAGVHYCRHHVIRAAIAAEIIVEVKPGGNRRPGVILAEGDQPVQG